MSSAAPVLTRHRLAARQPLGWPISRTVTVGALLLVLSALFLFCDGKSIPIQLWDESRNIVNALEMQRHGFRLITTFDGAPDMWNTKPPLMIWLMVASVNIFGASEWALRLPSMVAAMATILLLFWFVRRAIGSLTTAALAATLMVISPAYFGEHSALTADYDMVLLFFVCSYLCLLFFAVHRQRPSRILLGLIGVAILCALLTKSIAALVPGSGVALYILVTKRYRRLYATPDYAVLALCLVAAVAGFLSLYEIQSPGYLATIWHNDVGGRFGSALVPDEPRWFYFGQLFSGFFATSILALLSPVALFFTRGRTRQVLLFSLCIAVATLATFTCAETKLNHYILPVIPFMAIASAIVLHLAIDHAAVAWRADRDGSRLIAGAMLVVAITPVILGVAGAIARRYYLPVIGEGPRPGQYGAVFNTLVERSDQRIVVIDPGFILNGKPHYTPVLLAYREMWGARGVTIDHSTDLATADTAHGTLLASCDADGAARLLRRGRDIAGIHNCVAILAE